MLFAATAVVALVAVIGANIYAISRGVAARTHASDWLPQL